MEFPCVHRDFPVSFESTNLSRDNLSREIGHISGSGLAGGRRALEGATRWTFAH